MTDTDPVADSEKLAVITGITSQDGSYVTELVRVDSMIKWRRLH